MIKIFFVLISSYKSPYYKTSVNLYRRGGNMIYLAATQDRQLKKMWRFLKISVSFLIGNVNNYFMKLNFFIWIKV